MATTDSRQQPLVTTDETGIMQSACCQGSIVMGSQLQAECDVCGRQIAEGVSEVCALLGSNGD